MSDTKIEWATKVLNPVRGCSKVSEGCKNCYAIKQAHRFSGEGLPFEGLTQKTDAGVNWTGKLSFVPTAKSRKEIEKWKEPQRVFVNSMSDLFHEYVSTWFLDDLFGLFTKFPQHTFMILTKRPQRMMEYMQLRIEKELDHKPIPNVWLGVSVENQKAADERIPLLLQTPAAIRFLSCEPLLGPVNLPWLRYGLLDREHYNIIDWVIVGGESGHGARPMHPEWARSLRDQCQEAVVSFFFKQWGQWWPFPDEINTPTVRRNLKPNKRQIRFEDWYFENNGKKAAGRLLDGVEWNEFPNI